MLSYINIQGHKLYQDVNTYVKQKIGKNNQSYSRGINVSGLYAPANS